MPTLPTREAAELYALLKRDGRELVDFHFSPGRNPTPEGLNAEGIRAFKSAEQRNLPHTPPITGVPQTKL